jgi:CDP-diacylglycerol--serine O-phosphatidyltransferase
MIKSTSQTDGNSAPPGIAPAFSPSGPGASSLLAAVPNLFTLLNLFFGCVAIVFALQTESVIIYVNDEFGSSFNIPEKLTWAAIFIILAGVIDFLDGFIARLLHATSALGKQLDSLSDVVSFGVAPGVIFYQLLKLSFAREENGLDVSAVWLLPAFVLSCAAAWRLAKFNLDDKQTYHFSGIPTPAAGLLVASFPLILHYNSTLFNVGNVLINKWVLYSLIIILSYLMVSSLPVMGIKFKDYTLKNNIPKIVLLLVAIFGAFFLQWLAVPVIFVVYILLSLIYKKMLT